MTDRSDIEALAAELGSALLAAVKGTGKKPAADDQPINVVADRLGKSVRWVWYKLKEQRFQFHHYMGRTPLWTEDEFQRLRLALITAENEKRGHRDYRSRRATDSGTLSAPSGSMAAQSALEKVLAFPLSQKPGKKPTTSGSKRKAMPDKKPSMESGQVCRLPSRSTAS